MASHSESRIVPYTADLMYSIVADVERYPRFVPWCKELRILKREEVGAREVLLCETVVGFKGLRERYTSRATLIARDRRIDVEQMEGVFRKMETHWRITPEGQGCRIDFSIAFEFKSRMLSALAGGAFSLVIARMTHAFEERARMLSKHPLQ
jgi:coenzyme Q-binding protein COQ10